MDGLKLLICILIFTCTLQISTSYPFGAPAKDHVCKEMFPEGHHYDSQMDKPPYVIDVSSNVYSRSMEEFRVTVRATDGYFIRGIFIQARRANCSHPEYKDPLGLFQLLPGESYLKTLNCLKHTDSAITHTSNSTVAQATFKWFSPATKEGHLYFVATIVKEQDIFWTDVTSDILRENGNTNTWQKCPIRKLINPPHINTTPRPFTPTPRPEVTTTDKQKQGGNGASVVTVNFVLLALYAILTLCH